MICFLETFFFSLLFLSMTLHRSVTSLTNFYVSPNPSSRRVSVIERSKALLSFLAARPGNCEIPGRRDPWKQNGPPLNAPLAAAAAAITFASEQYSSLKKSWPYLWSRSPERRMHCYVLLLDLLRRESRILSQLRAGRFQGDMADRVWSHQENIHLVSTDLEEEDHTCFNLYIIGEGTLMSPDRTWNPMVKVFSSFLG